MASEIDDTGDVFAIRAVIESHGITMLAVDDLAIADLPFIRWAGSPSHLRSVAKQLARAPAGEVEYLAVRAPTGRPIAKGGVDYAVEEGAGMIWQLASEVDGSPEGTPRVITALPLRPRSRRSGRLCARLAPSFWGTRTGGGRR